VCEAEVEIQSMTNTAAALTNLLDAETPEDVYEMLDDACRALCDGLREISTSKTTSTTSSSLKKIRLEKNARKIREKLRLTDDADVRATMEACETVVREAVWAIAGERSGMPPSDDDEKEKDDSSLASSSSAAASAAVESKTIVGRVSHDRLRRLLVERVLHRVDKWRAKVTTAAERPREVLDAFDWSVRVVSASSSSGASSSGASCAAVARLRLDGDDETTTKHRVLRFDVPRHALDDVVAALGDARDAARRAFPSSSST